MFVATQVFSVKAQQQDEAEYTKVLTERSVKIVNTLDIKDKAVFDRVTEIMVNQYKALGKIHDSHDAEAKLIKGNDVDKASVEAKLAFLAQQRDLSLFRLHNVYLGNLSAELTNDQVEKVKDGMTYGVVMVTYNSYTDMIPSLKDFEKRQLMAWLIEAREYAMDAASSNKKHEWFGKYKGRFNNYLSRQGYDIQKERDEWNKRIAAKKKK